MAASQIATVSGTIIQIAGVIQEFGNRWYKASADWEDFPRKIARLKRKHDFWQKECRRSDMLSDRSLMETLGEAERLLDAEKVKLEAREARRGAGCWSMVGRAVFPAQVGLRIQLVIDAFDAIPGYLQMEEDAVVALENRMIRRATALCFRDDDRYVPLEVTESKVQKALNNSHGSPVVLLHGGPGKGKTALARHVALNYQTECKNPEGPFELVVFLECGPKVDVLTCQLILAQLIGANTAATAVQEQTGSDVAIRRRLSALLKHQKILIVFDDVWEAKFFQEMLNLCGVGVKCLVTSQNRELCRGLNLSHRAIEIQIEDITDDVAMQILASYVGFPGKQIPAHLQGQAHKMLEGTQGNPLALASVATGIDQDRSDQLVAWEAASQDLLKLLHSTETAYTFGMPYSKSFWSATQLSIQSLKEGAQILLILLHMCEAPSVPEEVLRVLYCFAVIPGVFETFETSRKHLESRGLIQICSQTLEYDNDRKLYSWTLHSLQKEFIAQETSDEKETILKVRKEAMLKNLASQSDGTNFEPKRSRLETKSRPDILAGEDSMVLLSLCSLYFHEQYLKTALKMETRSYQLNSLRRSAIEPITRFLALPVSDRWTKAAQGSAKQIYLTYIYNSALHDSAILDLLTLPISVLPVLQALEDIAIVESETILIDGNSGALMKVLLDFLQYVSNANKTTIAMAAIGVLAGLSGNKLHHGVMISSGILDTIANMLSSDSPPRIHVASMGILVKLTYQDEESKITISQHPRTFEHLLSSMSRNDSPKLQQNAVATLMNLSSNDVTRQRLVNFPGFLGQMVNLLSQESRPDLQTQTTMACKNLAYGVVAQITVNVSSAGKKLLASTSMVDSSKLQLKVAETLVNLTASDNDDTNQQLVNFPGLLEQLVNLLSQENKPDLQVRVAMALGNLDRRGVKQIIVDYSGAVQQLLALMAMDGSPKLQLEAAEALVNLTSSDSDITMQQLVNSPGLLEELVNLLSKGGNIDLQLAAAKCLCNLAQSQVNEMRLRMMHCSGLLDKFFHSLPEGQFFGECGWVYYVEALTYIDPARGNGIQLHFGPSYSRRGRANMMLNLNKEALDDLNRANKIEPGVVSTLRYRCIVRARLGDFEGALVDSNTIIEKHCTGLHLQERGVLKRMMGDLPGALADLNKSLELDPDDYEVLKHRGFVKFLMNDESGAHLDAQMALKLRPSRVDACTYGHGCLGTASVEFLDYSLR